MHAAPSHLHVTHATCLIVWEVNLARQSFVLLSTIFYHRGGRTKAGDSVRPKTQVIFVGRDIETIKWVMNEAMEAGRKGESPTHERIDLFQDNESKMVQPKIDHFFEEKKKARQQPSLTPRLGRVVGDEEHAYFRSPAGRQDPAVFWLRSRL